MILEFSFINNSTFLLLEKLFIKVLAQYKLDGKITKHDNITKLYVACDDNERLGLFANDFSSQLPHSIFLSSNDVKIVDDLPDENYKIPNIAKLPLSSCPKCLNEVTDKKNANYYNLFYACEICGYDIPKQPISLTNSFSDSLEYENIIKKVAKLISDEKIIKIKTFYGIFTVGKLTKTNISNINYDIVCYDLATISKYTKATNEEQIALASIEKPFIKLQTNLTFKCDFEDLKCDNARFKLSDNLILHFIMQELHNLNIDTVFISKDIKKFDEYLTFKDDVNKYELLEVVVSKEKVLVTRGRLGLSKVVLDKINNLSDYEFPFVVAKEHKIMDKKAICALYLSKENDSKVMFHSPKIGFIEHLPLTFKITTIGQLLEDVASQDDKAFKLMTNYKNKYSDVYNDIKDIKFEQNINLYQFWQVLALILKINDIEENCFNFLGNKGPRVDYKLQKVDNKALINPLKTIQSVISFKLAGTDNLTLSYGIMESFVDFMSNFIDDMKLDMNIEVVTINGSMLESQPLFNKLWTNISKNHKIYFNKKFGIDKR